MQLTNILRDVREDLDFGRVYLPQDELARFGYSEADLRSGVVNDAFIQLMQFQVHRAKEYFQSGFRLLPYLSPVPGLPGRPWPALPQHLEGHRGHRLRRFASPGLPQHPAKAAGHRADLAGRRHAPGALAPGLIALPWTGATWPSPARRFPATPIGQPDRTLLLAPRSAH